MKRSISKTFSLLLLIPVVLGLSGGAGKAGEEKPLAQAPAERIAYAYHGMLLDRDRKPIELDAKTVDQIQGSMIEELMKESDEATRKNVGLMIDELSMADKPGFDAGDRRLLNDAIIATLLEKAPKPAIERYEWRYRLVRSWSPVLKASPQALEWLRQRKIDFEDLILQGGRPDYLAECRAERVPIPPDWPSPQWGEPLGTLPRAFVASDYTAELYAYRDPAVPGVCLALPRKAGSSIQALGIICQGDETGKACFWDNVDSATGARLQGEGLRLSIASLQNGSSLAENCTNCHRGDNAFLVHPDDPPFRAASAGFDLAPSARYSPIGQGHWSNPGPLFLPAPRPPGRTCAECHEIPEPHGSGDPYCGVLRQASTQTMPRGGPPVGWPGAADSPFSTDMQFLAGHCNLGGRAASTVRIDEPDRDAAVRAALASITGAVSVAPESPAETITEVRISLGRQESEEEWAYDAGRRTYRWMTGPTGQWLSTRFDGTSWSAPSAAYTLPSGSDLPDGNYVVHAVLLTGSGARSEQVRRTFTIRR